MGFASRQIDLQFQLGTGSFGNDGEDTVTVKGLRVQATITRAGGVSMTEADVRVYGLTLDQMNKLTLLNKLRQYDTKRNTMTVSAGDENGVSVCFVGNIIEAWADMHSAPETSMYLRGSSGYVDLVRPVVPTSYNGSVDAATILSGLALQMTPPLTLENSGVSVQLASPYFPGTILDQIRAVARAGGFNCVIDDVQDRLAIWPDGGVRDGLSAVISPETGMVGYPTYTQNGIQVVTLYNPSLTFGTQIEVRSQLTPASGGWAIASVSHDLESNMPGGKWFTRVECGLIGQATPIVQ